MGAGAPGTYGPRRVCHELRSERVALTLLARLLFGALIGATGRLIRARKVPGGWLVSMAIGGCGSLLGGFVGQRLGVPHYDETLGFALPLVGAFATVFAYHALAMQRLRANPPPTSQRGQSLPPVRDRARD